MPPTIRPAEPRDLEALGRLGAMLIRTHYAFDPQRFLAPREGTEAGYASFLGSGLGDDEGHIFVADDGSGVVGYVYAALEPLSWKELRGPAGFIHDIVVGEDARPGGGGAAALPPLVVFTIRFGAALAAQSESGGLHGHSGRRHRRESQRRYPRRLVA